MLSVAPEPIGAPSSAALLRAYFTDIVSRYHGRPASDAEVDAAQQTEPSTEIPAYNREPYAEHWFERVLRPSVR
ncbi:MAG TPA: hypothetical protein VG756_04850 [Pseudonocardiaceae bacterium]|nr:hypothetical protein [Pseudonocardiaceae bacterium]